MLADGPILWNTKNWTKVSERQSDPDFGLERSFLKDIEFMKMVATAQSVAVAVVGNDCQF